MGNLIMTYIYNVFSVCSSWFTAIMTSADMVSVYIGMALMVLSVRLLLGPIFGVSHMKLSAGSDRASRRNSGDDDSDG